MSHQVVSSCHRRCHPSISCNACFNRDYSFRGVSLRVPSGTGEILRERESPCSVRLRAITAGTFFPARPRLPGVISPTKTSSASTSPSWKILLFSLYHGRTQTVKHVPCSLVRDSNTLMQFQCTNSPFGFTFKVHGKKPFA